MTRLLLQFIFPLGASLLVIGGALIMSLSDWRRAERVLLACAILTLWISATPVFASWLSWRVASQTPSIGLEAPFTHDAVILLGGTPLSRTLHASRLFRAGKAKRILVTGGNKPWQVDKRPEAERVADLLVELGTPRSALVLETESQNTRENAVNTAAVFAAHGWKNGLLVTSGMHMPRAFAAFENAGLSVTPAAADNPPEPSKRDDIFDLMPDAAALAQTTWAIKELIGFCFYRLRGWA